MAIVPIIKIKSDSPKGFRYINKIDFNKKSGHKLYKEQKKETPQSTKPQEIKTQAKVTPKETKNSQLLTLEVLKSLSEVALINYLRTHNIQPDPNDVTQDQLITKIALSDLIGK